MACLLPPEEGRRHSEQRQRPRQVPVPVRELPRRRRRWPRRRTRRRQEQWPVPSASHARSYARSLLLSTADLNDCGASTEEERERERPPVRTQRSVVECDPLSFVLVVVPSVLLHSSSFLFSY